MSELIDLRTARWFARGKHVYENTPDWPTFDPASGYATPPARLVADTETEEDARHIVAAFEAEAEPVDPSAGLRAMLKEAAVLVHTLSDCTTDWGHCPRVACSDFRAALSAPEAGDKAEALLYRDATYTHEDGVTRTDE